MPEKCFLDFKFKIRYFFKYFFTDIKSDWILYALLLIPAHLNTSIKENVKTLYRPTLSSGYLNSTMRRQYKDTRMSVENSHDMQSLTGKEQTRLGHLYVGIVSLLVVRVEHVQVKSVRSQLSDVNLVKRVKG